MKILHTSDWHLGKRLGDFSRIEEKKEVLAEIGRIAETEQVDLVLISGDLFDTWNPPVEAIELLYRTLSQLSDGGKRPVVAIAGNHDSPERIEAPDVLAREKAIFFSGFPHTHIQPSDALSTAFISHSGPGFITLTLPHTKETVSLLLTPYASEQRMKTCLGSENPEEVLRKTLSAHWEKSLGAMNPSAEIIVLVSHLYIIDQKGERPEEPLDEEKPILSPGGISEVHTENLPEGIQYAALGHLHRRQVIATHPCPVVYSGSPLSYSFSEASQIKSVEIAEAEPGKPVQHRQVFLKSGFPLIRKRFETAEDAFAWLPHHPDCYLEITLKTETFLSPETERELHKLHPRIVNLIPEIVPEGDDSPEYTAIPDPAADIENLFAGYFRKSRAGASPDSEMMNLFREILATEEESI